MRSFDILLPTVRRFFQRWVWLLFLIASLALAHILIGWVNNWWELGRSAVAEIFPLGILIFIFASFWFLFDSGRSGVVLAFFSIILIYVVALLFARSFDLSKLSYAHSFNLEIAILFIPMLSYLLGRYLSLPRQREPAQYEGEPEQRED